MNPQLLELALRKQRLQMQSADQRATFGAAAQGLAPMFSAADTVRHGVIWLRRNPLWLVGGIVALAVARPRRVLRWARRGFFAWQAWRRVEQWRLERPRR